jgi:hypothetical protein
VLRTWRESDAVGDILTLKGGGVVCHPGDRHEPLQRWLTGHGVGGDSRSSSTRGRADFPRVLKAVHERGADFAFLH